MQSITNWNSYQKISGDFPIVEHLWAYEVEQGIFICGDITDGVLRGECIPNGTNFFYGVNGSGVITQEYSATNDQITAMIAAINEKYGTSFTSYTPVEISGLDVGDDWPDWEAYEKIRMNNIKVAVDVGSGGYVLGLVNNNVFTMCVAQNGNAIIINQNGLVVNTASPANVMFDGYAKNVLNEQGFQTSELETEVIEVSLGETFPNYQEYLFIS